YLKSWDSRYRPKGLVILGVHSPEFAFEHSLGIVRAAVKRLGVRYPVALDNEFATWNAYQNQYWPADYVIDRTGRVRDAHAGEGARLRLNFLARSVHLVVGGRGQVHVKLNGHELRTVNVTADELYTLVTQQRAREGLLELSFTPGLSAYAFTFG